MGVAYSHVQSVVLLDALYENVDVVFRQLALAQDNTVLLLENVELRGGGEGGRGGGGGEGREKGEGEAKEE